MSLLLLLLVQADPSLNEAQVQARAIAEAIHLYEEYGGREAGAPGDLVKKSDGIEFWPDGGFWTGALPKDPWGGDYRIADRKVTASRDGVSAAIAPSGSGRIVPPNDRLRKYYSARVHLQLADIAGRAFERRSGKPPRRREDLGTIPKDPWGHDYEFVDRGKFAVLRLADPALRYVNLEAAETEALGKSAFLPLTPEEIKSVRAALERMTDDDFEIRKAAAGELNRFGRAILPLLDERLAREKDPFAKAWLGELSQKLPGSIPSWQRHITGLSVGIGVVKDRLQSMGCLMNLHRLQAMQRMREVARGHTDGPPAGEGAGALGKQYWLELARMKNAVIKNGDKVFVCPSSGIEADEDACTYRGPAKDVATLNAEDPIGMCDDESHGDEAIILTKGGEVKQVPRSDPLFFRALETTAR